MSSASAVDASKAQNVHSASRGNLPVAQLESTKFKLSQIMESILALQSTIECGGQSVMPAWPDILAKYNVLLSQSYNLSASLAAIQQAAQADAGQSRGTSSTNAIRGTMTKPFERFVMHPTLSMQDAQFDNEVIPILRNQQTTEVLRLESSTVRRLSERLPPAVISAQNDRPNAPETHHSVVDACSEIRGEHDALCDRAMRAVALLTEQYDWKARLEVEEEEPEDFMPGPGFGGEASGMLPSTAGTVDNDEDDDEEDNDDVNDNESMAVDDNDKDEDSSAEEAEMAEQALGPPSSSPFPMT